MISIRTKFWIADNSGGVLGKCIKIASKGQKSIGLLGSLIKISILKKKGHTFKKRSIYHGLIIMLSRRIKRKDGTFVKFTKNRILLLSTSQKFLGTRIYGVYFKELKLMANKNKSSNVKHFKLLSYSNSII